MTSLLGASSSAMLFVDCEDEVTSLGPEGVMSFLCCIVMSLLEVGFDGESSTSMQGGA